MTLILRQLERMICDKQMKSTLLYKISRDGCDPDIFHRLCDNKGPTLTIVYTVNNTIYGGYTSQSWTNEGLFKDDKKAFLFFKEDHKSSEIIKMPIKEYQHEKAIFCGKDKGPIFGGVTFLNENLVYKYDVSTFTKIIVKNAKGNFCLNGDVKLDGAYDRGTIKSAKMKGGTMEVMDLEVYQVEVDELNGLWRKIPENAEELRKKFHGQQTFDKNLPNRNILLIGIIGSGKSSFRNLLESAIKGEIIRASAYGDSEFSMTNQLTYNELKTKSEQPLTVRIYDTRGIEETRGMENEIQYILDGLAPDNYKFQDQSTAIVAKKPSKGLHEEIHLICMVMDASQLLVLTDKHKTHIKHIQKAASHKGLHMVAVVTKLDQICEKVSTDVNHLYKDPTVSNAIKTATAFLGLQEDQVFPICNYSTEKVNDPDKDAIALDALLQMISTIDDTLRKKRGMILLEDDWRRRGHNLGLKKMFLEEEIFSTIQNSTYRKHGFRVLLVGPTKVGKSSYINSVVTALLKNIASKVVYGSTDDERTKKLRSIPMKYQRGDGDLETLPVTLCDMQGIGDGEIPTNKDIEYIIDGHVSYKNKLVENVTKQSSVYTQNPQLSDKVHCVALVLDSSELQKMTQKTSERMRGLKKLLTQKEVPYIVLLTKVDILCINLKIDVSEIYESEEVRKAADYVCDMLGIKLKYIFPIRNYDSETHVINTLDEIILESFKQAVNLCETFLERCVEDKDFITSSDSYL